jgi:hypothetical protein
VVLRPTNLRLEEEILEALQAIKERDGVSVTEQVRRALRAWIEQKGITVRAERKRAATRKRS